MLPWTCGGEPPRIEGHTDGQIVTHYQMQQHVPSNRRQCHDKGCAPCTFYSLLTSGSLINISMRANFCNYFWSLLHLCFWSLIHTFFGVLCLEDSSLFPVRCTNSSCSPNLSQLLPKPAVWHCCTFRVGYNDQIFYSWCHQAKQSLLQEKYHLGTLPREASPCWGRRGS